MSFEKFERMNPEELEAKILKFKSNLRYIPTKIGEDSTDNFILKLKKFLSSLKLNDILSKPQDVYQSLLDTLGIDQDTFENIIILILTIAAGLRTYSIIKELGKYTKSDSKVNEWLGKFTIISLICSIYMTIIEIYCLKTNKNIKEDLYQYAKDRWDATIGLWNTFKSNWYKPWVVIKYLITEYFVKSTLKYWEWQWKVGRIDPTHTYHTVFVINWLVNFGWCVCSILSAMELQQTGGYQRIIDSIMGKAQSKGLNV